jgi:hypothetical protein
MAAMAWQLAPAAAATNPPPPAADNLRLVAPIKVWDDAIPLGNGLMGGLLFGVPVESNPGIPPVCQGFLRHRRPGLTRRDVAGRPTTRRLGPIRDVTHHERVERPSLLAKSARTSWHNSKWVR